MTAADYAVVVKGLDVHKKLRGKEGLEALFYKDMKKLGYGLEPHDHKPIAVSSHRLASQLSLKCCTSSYHRAVTAL